jgi:hypothetical protein
MTDVTLQINLSAGDSTYAAWTVPAIIAAHPGATERLLVVDLCKPQATRIIDPARRYAEPAYTARQQKVLQLSESWLASGLVDRVVALRPGDPLFPVLSRRYLRPWARETHDYGGCALMAYLAAFELCRTRWLLHFDADMLVHQAAGFDWVGQGQQAMAGSANVIAAVPRPSPPSPDRPEIPSENERLAFRTHASGWLNAWFSTRCYLFDLERLRPLLPLLQGGIYWENILVRLLNRGYPRSPEVILHRRLRAADRWRLMLRDERAWLLHPVQKDAAFVAVLPRLLEAVRKGEVPAGQRGQQDLDLAHWTSLLG